MKHHAALVSVVLCSCGSPDPERAAPATAVTYSVPVDASAEAERGVDARLDAPPPLSPLEWFNNLSGRLNITLSEEPVAVSQRIVNRRAPSTARIRAIDLDMSVLETGKFRDLTDAEWAQVVVAEPTIRMRSLTKKVVTHRAPDGRAFTVRDLVTAILETERKTRGGSDWLGGIDVHHRYFQFIERGSDGVWTVSWGS